MRLIRYNLPGILVWLIAISFFLAIFLEYFGAAWGPPFYMAYGFFLILFAASFFVPAPEHDQPGSGSSRESQQTRR
jgi:hypothetical protein